MTRPHKVYCRHAAGRFPRLDAAVIKRAVYTALSVESVSLPCEVSVFITNDRGVRGLNREYRNIDAATDVLSFPQHTLKAGQFEAPGQWFESAGGRLLLGDIVLSSESVERQAAALGRSVRRETAYLTVHSLLHLLGYDHADAGDGQRAMREREKAIMRSLQIRP
jgi:probable rRNA maturation factor